MISAWTPGASLLSLFTSGIKKASVFPDPVGANSIKFGEVAAFWIEATCIGLSSAMERFLRNSALAAVKFSGIGAKVGLCLSFWLPDMTNPG